jgi:hypothetical protein
VEAGDLYIADTQLLRGDRQLPDRSLLIGGRRHGNDRRRGNCRQPPPTGGDELVPLFAMQP